MVFSRFMPKSGIAGSYGSSIFSFSLSPHQFTFLSMVHKGSLFSLSLPTLDISCLFDNSHSNRCELISHCGFDLHFPDD